MTNWKTLIASARSALAESTTGIAAELTQGRVIQISTPRLDRLGQDFTNRLKDLIGADKAEGLVASKAKRDGANFHVTLVSPPEVTALLKKRMADLPGLSRREAEAQAKDTIQKSLANLRLAADWTVHGIGKAESGGSEAYFVVLDWPSAQNARKSLGLPSGKDLHITLGFSKTDVHDAPKDRNSLVLRK